MSIYTETVTEMSEEARYELYLDFIHSLDMPCPHCEGGMVDNIEIGTREFCEKCDGRGYQLTETGELFASFLERHGFTRRD